jgi:AcrR family transcriptional regulator
MRYGSDQKAITRARIVEKAGERFKADGIVASGISTLMADAGLTNGAFYAHFNSKDDLVTATVAEQLRAEQDRFVAVADDPHAFAHIVREYLSPGHRDNPAHGCPTAALVAEIGHSVPGARAAFTNGVVNSIRPLAAGIWPEEHDAQARALAILAVMAGTLQVARGIDDRALSDALLEQGIANVLALVK